MFQFINMSWLLLSFLLFISTSYQELSWSFHLPPQEKCIRYTDYQFGNGGKLLVAGTYEFDATTLANFSFPSPISVFNVDSNETIWSKPFGSYNSITISRNTSAMASLTCAPPIADEPGFASCSVLMFPNAYEPTVSWSYHINLTLEPVDPNSGPFLLMSDDGERLYLFVTFMEPIETSFELHTILFCFTNIKSQDAFIVTNYTWSQGGLMALDMELVNTAYGDLVKVQTGGPFSSSMVAFILNGTLTYQLNADPNGDAICLSYDGQSFVVPGVDGFWYWNSQGPLPDSSWDTEYMEPSFIGFTIGLDTWVNSCSFGEDGLMGFSYGVNQTGYKDYFGVMQLKDGELNEIWSQETLDYVTAASILSSSGKLLVVLWDTTVPGTPTMSAYDAKTGKLVYEWTCPDEANRDLLFSDPTIIAVSDDDPKLTHIALSAFTVSEPYIATLYMFSIVMN